MDERVTVDAEPTQDPVWALPDEAEELAPLEGEPAPVAAPMPAMTQRSAQVVVEEASDEPVEAPAPPDDPLANATDQRRAHRSVARLAVRLDTKNFSLDGRTRDLSQTGVLVSADGSELPIGKLIRLELEHPESGERIEVSGTVTRHIEAGGTVAAIGINFEPSPDQEALLRDFVNEAKRVGARREAGGISGRIEEVGMLSLIQMLSASSDVGTLTAQSGAEEALFAFEAGSIRYVRLGALKSVKALTRMLTWEQGTFQFHSDVDELSEEDDPIPLTSAILEAACQLDEADRSSLPHYELTTTFAVDLNAAREAKLSQVQQAVLELAMPGLTLRRILDVIPEADATVLEGIQSLVEEGVVSPEKG